MQVIMFLMLDDITFLFSVSQEILQKMIKENRKKIKTPSSRDELP